MPVLLITSAGGAGGKTALASALALLLTQHGRSVALARPAVLDDADPSHVAADLAFYAQVAPQSLRISGLPIRLPNSPSSAGSRPWRDLLAPALSANVALLEGLDLQGEQAAQIVQRQAEALDAKVVIVARYRTDLDAQQLTRDIAPFRQRVLGVLLNQVPRHRAVHASQELSGALQRAGLPVLGIVPEDRRMAAPTLRQIAEMLNGEFLLLPEKADELVESLMVGGWFLDEGRYVFSQRQRKAVLVRGDRPDLQMAALETDTVGLILTDGKEPVQYTVYHAETRGVPLVKTPLGTVAAMERLQGLHARTTVHHPHKAQRFLKLLDAAGTTDKLLSWLGIAPAQATGARSA